MMDRQSESPDQKTKADIFTIGHGKRSWEGFVELLKFHGVKRVVDVRAYPSSRKSPHFCKEKMELALAEEGISYRWEGRALGGFREPKGRSPHISLKNPGMRAYADHMASQEFRQAASRVMRDASWAKTAIMCAEVDPFHCHRGLLADYLTVCGHRVFHIRSKSQPQLHKISPLARVEGQNLIYDVPPPLLPGPQEEQFPLASGAPSTGRTSASHQESSQMREGP